MPRRLKVLLCAYACSPISGSEPGVGWGYVKAISASHDLWVITEEDEFRADIEAELARDPALGERVHFHFIPKSRHPRLRKLWPPSFYWFYGAWHRKALALARHLAGEVPFDLAHQLNMVTYREPGFLWTLGLPFVWGPIGGTDNVPWQLLPVMGPSAVAYHVARNVVNAMQLRLLRRPRRAAERAGPGLIAATSSVAQAAARQWGRPATVLCEVGAPDANAATPAARPAGQPLRIAWSGQHTPGKALPLLLHALRRTPADVDWSLDILGDGPCTGRWQRAADALGLQARCTWHGWIDRQEALDVVARAHVFVITSLKDLTSSVLLEALSLGVPVVCLDHCGFADVVTAQCGIRIPVASPSRIVQDLTGAIGALARDEPRRRRLASGALERAAAYSWQAKAEVINHVYRGVLDGHA